MEDLYFLKVIGGPPMQRELEKDTLQNAQYTILCAQEADPEKRINMLLERIATSSEMSATQCMCFIMNTCVESQLEPDFVEAMVEQLVKEAKTHCLWPNFIKWVCGIIHYFCTDDATVCVFYEFGAPDVAVEGLKAFPHLHHMALAASVLLSHFTLFEMEESVQQLTLALQTYVDDASVCRRTTEALAEFTRFDKDQPGRYVEVCREFVAEGGFGVLGEALGKHMTAHPDICFSIACIAANVANSRVLQVDQEDVKEEEERDDMAVEEETTEETTMKDAAADPGESLVVHLLAKLLVSQSDSHSDESGNDQRFLSDRFIVQVIQVLSHFPRSSFIDWDCLSSLFLKSESEAVLLWCVHFFSEVAMNVKELKSVIYSTGCVTRVLEVMKKYHENCAIQEVGCSLLSYLSFDSEVITQCITEHGGIGIVLDAMREFPASEQLLMSACAALSGLTFNNQAGQQEIIEHKGIALILDAMRFGKKPRLQENGCLAIGTMCWNSDLKAEVVRLGGVEVIMKALEDHYTSSGVVKNAFRALAQIAFNCEKYRNEMSASGMIPLIIRGMEQHQHYDRAQMHGCVALSYLSWTNQGNAAQITAHRGYQVVVEAMKNHPHNHEVQEHAARALANISHVSLKDAAAALEQIVASMRRHERCSEVQEEACRAIVTLSLISPANKDKLYELGGAEVVVAAMKNFTRLPLVQQEASNALAHLAYEHPQLNRVVTELHGVELLLNAMRNHPDSPKVQLNACGGLSALAFDNAVAQRQIFELGGVKCVVRAMENFERLRMLELGCSALGTLAWNTEIKEKVAVEAVPEILKAMRIHESSPLLQKSTCRAISQFAFNSEINRQLLADAGAIPLIVKAMRTHLKTEKLIVHALKALTYLCWENVHVAESIIQENIEEVLQGIVDFYPEKHRVYGEAIHLSKILFRKTAGSQSPSMKPISPPLTSPHPLSMLASPSPGGGSGPGGRRGGGRGSTGGNTNNSSSSYHASNSPQGGAGYPPLSPPFRDPDEQGLGVGGGGGRRGGRGGGGRQRGGGGGRGGGRGGGSNSTAAVSGSSDNHRFSNRLFSSPGQPQQGSHRNTTTTRMSDGRHHSQEQDPNDLWDDPAPSTFHGNRVRGEQNWREEVKAREKEV